MICESCKIDRIEKDFINNQEFCYRCEYRRKLANPPKKRTERKTLCRMCSKEINHIKDLKKRQRTVFCSLQCAKKGHKEMTTNHWTRQVRSGSF